MQKKSYGSIQVLAAMFHLPFWRWWLRDRGGGFNSRIWKIWAKRSPCKWHWLRLDEYSLRSCWVYKTIYTAYTLWWNEKYDYFVCPLFLVDQHNFLGRYFDWRHLSFSSLLNAFCTDRYTYLSELHGVGPSISFSQLVARFDDSVLIDPVRVF